MDHDETQSEFRSGENPMAEKVSGYRKLDDTELALVNRIKGAGTSLQELFDEIERVITERNAAHGTPDAECRRALALGKTNIQQGYMWLIRAVAAPNGLI